MASAAERIAHSPLEMSELGKPAKVPSVGGYYGYS
jgi:hypothetical protein